MLSSRLDDGPSNFEGYKLCSEIVESIKSLGYNRPTLIQHFAIPEVLLGRNTLIAAETGSGKTLAYAAPLLHMLMQKKTCYDPWESGLVPSVPLEQAELVSSTGPKAIVLTPGRELAYQTCDMVRNLARGTDLVIGKILAGNVLVEEIAEEVKKDVLVGTPGILRHLVKQEELPLDRLSHVIVDEADSLLDDTFSNQIIDLLSNVQVTKCDVLKM